MIIYNEMMIMITIMILSTRVKISDYYILYTAWRIDRGSSRMLEHTKSDLIQQPSSRLNIMRDV